MKYCANCGHGLDDQAAFCPACGTKQAPAPAPAPQPAVNAVPTAAPAPAPAPQPAVNTAPTAAPVSAPQRKVNPFLSALLFAVFALLLGIIMGMITSGPMNLLNRALASAPVVLRILLPFMIGMILLVIRIIIAYLGTNQLIFKKRLSLGGLILTVILCTVLSTLSGFTVGLVQGLVSQFFFNHGLAQLYSILFSVIYRGADFLAYFLGALIPAAIFKK